METLCHTLLTMTLTSTAAALVVMALRPVLRGTPRNYIYMLWIVVIARMLWPFGFMNGPVHFIPEPVTSGRAAEVILDRNRTAPAQTMQEPEPTVQGAEAPVQPVQEVPIPTVTPYQVMGGVWIAGLAGMLLWTAVSYGRVRRRVAEAVMTEPEVYESDRIDTPFVLGGNIYLPAGLTDPDRRYVLLHEQAHVERYDPFFKGLAWLALAVHWFNPVLWLAYRLLCRDIETGCDRQVLEGFDPETRREDTAGYAAALLHLGRRERLPQTVLPFGEENARGRIKNVLQYRFKRPAAWVLVLTVVLFAAVWMGLMSNPRAREETVEIQGREVYFADAEWTEDETGETYTVTLNSALLRELAEILEDAPSRTYESREAMEGYPALAGWNGASPLTGEIGQLTFWCENNTVCVLSGWENGTVLWADGAGDNYLLYPDVKNSKAFRDWELKFAALIRQTKTPVLSPSGNASHEAAEGDFLPDGEQLYEVHVMRPVYQSDSQTYGQGVAFPESLTRELENLLRALPHKDIPLPSEPSSETGHGDLVPLLGDRDSIWLSGNHLGMDLYVFSDGTGILYDLIGRRTVEFPDLGTSGDFLAWQEHAKQWLNEDFPKEVYAKCTDPALDRLPPVERARTVLGYLGCDVLLDPDAPVASWKNGVLRLNLAQLTLGDDGEAAADLVQNYLGGVCRLLRTVLTDVDRVVFVTKDGAELTVDVSGGAPLDEAGFVRLFNDRAPAAGPPFKVVNGTYSYDPKTAAEPTAASAPARTTAASLTANRGTAAKPVSDPAALLLGKATTVRRAGPGRSPGDEVRDLFFSAGAGRYLNKDNALMYIQNNEVKVLLTEDTDADARELTRAANLTLALTDGSDTFRVYDKDGNAVVDTYGDQGVMEEEDFRAMYRTETGEPRPAPPQTEPEEPETAPALPEGFTMTLEPPPPPEREIPDSMNFEFTQTDQTTTNEGVE